MSIPQELRYTDEHEWIRTAGNIATIGITDFAQSELGDIVFVELPEVGAEFTAGDVFGTVESVKTVSELYLPVSGKIVKINTELEDSPGNINESPYQTGWMIELEMKNAEDVNALLSADGYQAAIGK